jgi:hypothetical protein
VWIEPSGSGELRVTSWPWTIEYQLPAPSIVTLSTTMCRFTWNTPSGMKTVLAFALASAIAASNASAESFRPVGSAPYWITETERGGRFSGFPTSWKSTTSTIVHAAFVFAGAVKRTVSPAR